jgi:acetyl-CoA carboxylase biotin carboxyl carrier protein
MNIKEVKDLISEILHSDISEFELEHTGTRLRLRRGGVQETGASIAAAPAHHVPSISTPPVIHRATEQAYPSPQPPAPPEQPDDEAGLHFITSPIVGTFYRAPKPDAEPFVKPGQIIEEGTTLCIVEAMKLLNEIPSDLAGEIVRIYVENARPVEFGQRLFAVRPRS